MKWRRRLLGLVMAVAAIAIAGVARGQEEEDEPELPRLLEPPQPDVMTDERGAAEEVPGITVFRLGRVRVYTAPVVVEFPTIAAPRDHGAVLPGITIRLPWLVP